MVLSGKENCERKTFYHENIYHENNTIHIIKIYIINHSYSQHIAPIIKGTLVK